MRTLALAWRHALSVPLLLVGLLYTSPSMAQPPADWTKFCLRGQDPESMVVCFERQGTAVESEVMDAETFAKRQAALSDELRRRAEEARKKLEGQPK